MADQATNNDNEIVAFRRGDLAKLLKSWETNDEAVGIAIDQLQIKGFTIVGLIPTEVRQAIDQLMLQYGDVSGASTALADTATVTMELGHVRALHYAIQAGSEA